MTKIAALLLLFASSHVCAATVAVETCNVDEVYARQDVSCDVALTNLTSTSLVISDIEPMSPADSVRPNKLQLAPSEVAHVTAYLDLLNNQGESAHYFSYKVDGKSNDVGFEIHGFVNSILDQAKPTISFGVVNAENLATSRADVTLSSQEVPSFKITKIIQTPSYLAANISDDGQKIVASLKPNTPWGIHKDALIVATNSQRQPLVRVSTDVDVHGAVVADSNPFGIGLLRQGEKKEVTIRVTDRTHKPLRLENPELTKLSGNAEIDRCIPDAADCRLLKFRFDDKQTLGSIVGNIALSVPDYRETLRIYLWGLLVKRDAEILDMDKEMSKQSAASASSEVQPKQSISDMLSNATKAVELDDPSGNGPLLKWQVSNEQALHGYAIYRADRADGPFTRVNDHTVLVKDNGTSSQYAYRDVSAQSGKSYWYYVGVVYRDGHKQKLTDPQKVVAK